MACVRIGEIPEAGASEEGAEASVHILAYLAARAYNVSPGPPALCTPEDVGDIVPGPKSGSDESEEGQGFAPQNDTEGFRGRGPPRWSGVEVAGPA